MRCCQGAGEEYPRYPIRPTFPAGCARAASGAARRLPAKVPRNTRRSITRSPGVSLRGFATSPCSFVAAHRERERERRADSDLARHPDPSPVQLDELARERQPKPRALRLLVRRPHLAKLLEHRLLI